MGCATSSEPKDRPQKASGQHEPGTSATTPPPLVDAGPPATQSALSLPVVGKSLKCKVNVPSDVDGEPRCANGTRNAVGRMVQSVNRMASRFASTVQKSAKPDISRVNPKVIENAHRALEAPRDERTSRIDNDDNVTTNLDSSSARPRGRDPRMHLTSRTDTERKPVPSPTAPRGHQTGLDAHAHYLHTPSTTASRASSPSPARTTDMPSMSAPRTAVPSASRVRSVLRDRSPSRRLARSPSASRASDMMSLSVQRSRSFSESHATRARAPSMPRRRSPSRHRDTRGRVRSPRHGHAQRLGSPSSRDSRMCALSVTHPSHGHLLDASRFARASERQSCSNAQHMRRPSRPWDDHTHEHRFETENRSQQRTKRWQEHPFEPERRSQCSSDYSQERRFESEPRSQRWSERRQEHEFEPERRSQRWSERRQEHQFEPERRSQCWSERLQEHQFEPERRYQRWCERLQEHQFEPERRSQRLSNRWQEQRCELEDQSEHRPERRQTQGFEQECPSRYRPGRHQELRFESEHPSQHRRTLRQKPRCEPENLSAHRSERHWGEQGDSSVRSPPHRVEAWGDQQYEFPHRSRCSVPMPHRQADYDVSSCLGDTDRDQQCRTRMPIHTRRVAPRDDNAWRCATFHDEVRLDTSMFKDDQWRPLGLRQTLPRYKTPRRHPSSGRAPDAYSPRHSRAHANRSSRLSVPPSHNQLAHREDPRESERRWSAAHQPTRAGMRSTEKEARQTTASWSDHDERGTRAVSQGGGKGAPRATINESVTASTDVSSRRGRVSDALTHSVGAQGGRFVTPLCHGSPHGVI